MADQLKACPMCGSEVKLISGFEPLSHHFVDCDACGVSSKLFDTAAEAIAAWNTRAEPVGVPTVQAGDVEHDDGHCESCSPDGLCNTGALCVTLGLDSAQSAQAVDGWKLVPIEPTEDMYQAIEPLFSSNTEISRHMSKKKYQLMISAAPSQPVAGKRLPIPFAIDQTHPNQEWVSLGFNSKEERDIFVKLTKSGDFVTTANAGKECTNQPVQAVDGWRATQLYVQIDAIGALWRDPKTMPVWLRNSLGEIYKNMSNNLTPISTQPNTVQAKALTDEQIARLFHDTYERLAPSFGWDTQARCKREYDDLPPENKRLMVATCKEVRALLASQPAPTMYRLLNRQVGKDEWRNEGRMWVDGLPTAQQLEDIRQTNEANNGSDGQGRIEYKYEYAASCQQPSAPADMEAVRDANPSKIEITLTGDRIKQLLELCSPDHEADPQQLESEMTLVVGDGHSGHGLYAYWTDYPEEGAVAMFDAGTDGDDDTAPTAQPQADGVAK